MADGVPSELSDAALLEHAVALATANVAEGGGPFGAVVARRGLIIATGTNRVTAELDPTAHAEIEAIRAACRASNGFRLEGLTLYSSCEPCPMCFAAAHWARLDRIVFAADRNDAAAVGFDDAMLHDQLALPLNQRRLSLERLELVSAAAPFVAWRARSDRTSY